MWAYQSTVEDYINGATRVIRALFRDATGEERTLFFEFASGLSSGQFTTNFQAAISGGVTMLQSDDTAKGNSF